MNNLGLDYTSVMYTSMRCLHFGPTSCSETGTMKENVNAFNEVKQFKTGNKIVTSPLCPIKVDTGERLTG